MSSVKSERLAVFSALRFLDEVEAEFSAEFDVVFEKTADPAGWIVKSGREFDVVLVSLGASLGALAIATLPPRVRAIATYSVGMDHIDLKAAAARGIAAVSRPLARRGSRRNSRLVSGTPLQLISYPAHRRVGPVHGRRSEGTETAQLRIHVAGTGVGRRVDEPVARHDTVDASTPDPVMRLPPLRPDIDELDAGSRREQETLGRL